MTFRLIFIFLIFIAVLAFYYEAVVGLCQRVIDSVNYFSTTREKQRRVRLILLGCNAVFMLFNTILFVIGFFLYIELRTLLA